MKLTSVVFRGFKIPGARFRGKVRMVKVVTPYELNNIKTDFKIEEKNMLYLRNPYLTLEQSRRFTKMADAEARENRTRLSEKYAEVNKKFAAKSTTLMDKLGHLRYTEDWDVIK